jgi:hypothetical protein
MLMVVRGVTVGLQLTMMIVMTKVRGMSQQQWALGEIELVMTLLLCCLQASGLKGWS